MFKKSTAFQMDLQKKVQEAVETIKKATGLNQDQISVRAGYKEQTLTQTLSSGKVSPRMLKAIEKEFSEILKKSIFGHNRLSSGLKQVTASPDKNLISKERKKKVTNHSTTENTQAMQSLIESNRSLGEAFIRQAAAQEKEAEARIIQAEANKIIADSYSRMLQTIEPTVNELNEIQKADAAKSLVHDEILIKLGVVTGLWKDEAEGRAKLHTSISGDGLKDLSGDIPENADMLSK